jgi:MFS family permease
MRATATLGWMVGCWLVSAMRGDTSVWAAYGGAVCWLVLAAFTFVLPNVPPPPSKGRVTFRERMGWDALSLLKQHDHRVVFITVALFSIPLAAFYPLTPPHLEALGFKHVSAWMSLGQVTEIITMFALAGLFRRWRLKWIFSGGLVFGVLRYALCAVDRPGWLLAGITLHGLSYTLFFITAQIYLNERVEVAWRARAQGLLWLMNTGVGHLLGYLGSGFWFRFNTHQGTTTWGVFWGGLAIAVGLVLAYFLIAYHGKGPGLRRLEAAPEKAGAN